MDPVTELFLFFAGYQVASGWITPEPVQSCEYTIQISDNETVSKWSPEYCGLINEYFEVSND